MFAITINSQFHCLKYLAKSYQNKACIVLMKGN